MRNQSVEPSGWSGQGEQIRLILQTGNSWEKNEPRDLFMANPFSGDMTRADSSVPSPTDNSEVSPDRHRRFHLTKQKQFTLTETATGESRTFVFHADDQRLADEENLRWVSPRYIEFDNGFETFIDSDTLKMNYALPAKVKLRHFEFSSDFRWTIASDDQGVWLGRVVLP